MSRIAAMTAGVRTLSDKGFAIGDESAAQSGDAFNSVLSGFGGKGGLGSKSPATEGASAPIVPPDEPRVSPTSENAAIENATMTPSSASSAATLIRLFANVSQAAPSAGTAIQLPTLGATKPAVEAKTSEADPQVYPAPKTAPQIVASRQVLVDPVTPPTPTAAPVAEAPNAEAPVNPAPKAASRTDAPTAIAATVAEALVANAPVYPAPKAASRTSGLTPTVVDRVTSAPAAVDVKEQPVTAVGNAASSLITFLQAGPQSDKENGTAPEAVAPAPSAASPHSAKAPAVKGSAPRTEAAPAGGASVDQNTAAVLALASMVGGLPPSPPPATVALPKSGPSVKDAALPAASKIARPEQPVETTALEPKAVLPSTAFAGRDTTSDGGAKERASPSAGNTGKAGAAVENIVMNVSGVDTATHFLPVGFAAPMQQIADAITTATSSDSSAQASGVTTGSGAPDASDAAKPAGPLKTLTIGLEPENLGSVSVSMRVSGNRLDVEIEASRPETTRLIGKDKDVLSQTLQSSGYSLDSLVVKSAVASGTDTGAGSSGGQQHPSSSDSNAQSSFGQSRDPDGRRPPSQFAGNPGNGAPGGGGAGSPSRDGRDGVYL